MTRNADLVAGQVAFQSLISFGEIQNHYAVTRDREVVTVKDANGPGEIVITPDPDNDGLWDVVLYRRGFELFNGDIEHNIPFSVLARTVIDLTKEF